MYSFIRSLNYFYTMIYRQVKRFLRARSRVVVSIVQPILWIFLFGMGMGGVFNFQNPMIDAFIRQQFNGLDYMTFLLTGIVAMSIFIGSFISGVSVIFDKQFGFLKETLVSPAPREIILLGRAVGDSLVILINASIVLTLGFMISNQLRPEGILPALSYGFVLSIGFASLGIAIASRMNSMEGFQMLMNLLIMPLQFVSGIFFPIQRMPDWMQIIAKINPLTYAVDGIRYWLTGRSEFDPMIDIILLMILSIIFLVIAMWSFRKATIEE
ncbi:MAG: ABC transporter permease [Desulfurococcales archaeon]|nr:ABC transporter permease [Desulfurococcales archaeon]